jgi:hypothetical protein
MATTKRSRTAAKTHANGSQTSAAAAAPLDSIAARAYELWRASGCVHGNDQAHWFQAEQELRARAPRS